MRDMKIAGAAILLIAIMAASSPASAVILEETYMGWISKLEPSYDKLTIYVTEVYQGEGNWLTYGQSGLKNNIVTGTVTNPFVFEDLKQGDSVEVTILGGPGGEWITIGRIGSVGSTEKPIISCYGDPSRLVSPFYKNYKVIFDAKPDCDLCEGTVCTASAAQVKIERDGEVVESAEMFPGSTHVFGWDSSYQYIPLVTFVSGEADSSPCLSSEDGGMMTGPQAVSDFKIDITQRNTIVKSEVETLETTAQTAVATTAKTTAQAGTRTDVPSTAATPETPGFTTICALSSILVAVGLVSKRFL